jgi:nitrogen regulatory protein PII-like uncharacterized protein
MVFYVLYKYAMNSPTNLVSKVEDEIESAAKKVDDLANDALHKLVERVPETAKVVAVVDEALAGSACSCGLFGWTLSASRSRRSPAKPAALSSEEPK